MRRSVFGIWIGLLVLALASGTLRFLLFSSQNPDVPVPGLIFNYLVAALVIVAVWVLTLRFIEGRQRRQAAAMQARFPGSVTFPSLPDRELDASARLLDPTVELDGADALTVVVDARGVSVRHRGADSTALLLGIDRAAVIGVDRRVDGTRRGGHPSIEFLLQTPDGLIPLRFSVFQTARPFRRASVAQADYLVAEAREALAG